MKPAPPHGPMEVTSALLVNEGWRLTRVGSRFENAHPFFDSRSLRWFSRSDQSHNVWSISEEEVKVGDSQFIENELDREQPKSSRTSARWLIR